MRFDHDFEELESLRGIERPARGWLRAAREAAGVSAGELGRRLGVSRQLPLQFERAEATDTITLKSLRTVAAALNCELVYALVPREGGRPQNSVSTRKKVQTETATQPTESASTLAEANANSHFCD